MSAQPKINVDGEYAALVRFLQLAPIGLVQTSLDGQIISINPTCTRLLMPLTRAGALTNLFTVLEGAAPDLRQAVAQFADAEGIVREAMRLRPTRTVHGNIVTLELSLSLLKVDRSRLMAVITDRRDKQRADQQPRKAAEWDGLTGLANRRVFVEAAEREVMRYQRSPRDLSMLLINVDALASVNDAHGRAGGDAVLRNLAVNLSAGLREADLVARIADEEFALLLPATGLEGAYAAANRLRRTIEAQSVPVDGRCIRYTVSGGVAAMGSEVSDLEAFMKRTRHALSAAKSGGRNRIESR